ncbi:MAG: hypothetical protein NTW78_05645 [Campylobacterales bacterium]|nr:hypothetical protein [Campylobacterales bacterium]
MENPFESGHIKNYILLYVSVVVIMVLFFIATTLFNEVESVDKKVFDTSVNEVSYANKPMKNIEEVNSSGIKLLEKAY